MEFILTGVLVSIIAQIVKRFGLKEKANGAYIHLLLLGLALGFSLLKFGFGFLPEIYVTSIIQIWGGAVLVYEFLFKTIYQEIIKHPVEN
jgi:uncharacterized protein (DUF697 family)